MEVQFTPEPEARILQIANYSGTPASSWSTRPPCAWLKKTSNSKLISESHLNKADRDELIDHEQVNARISRSASVIVRWTEKAVLSFEDITNHIADDNSKRPAERIRQTKRIWISARWLSATLSTG